MAFPRDTVWGPEGEQFSTYTTQRYRLGHKLIVDDCTYRFYQAGAALISVGSILQQQAPDSNHVNMTAVAAAVGATTITTSAITTTANQYADGFVGVSVTPGQGYRYRIASPTGHAATSNAALTATLAPGTSVQVALTTASKLELILNKFASIIITPLTLTAAPVGVAASTVAAGSFGWMQTSGACLISTSGTVVVGNVVGPAAGVVGTGVPGSVWALTLVTQPGIGTVTRVATTGNFSEVVLAGLEG